MRTALAIAVLAVCLAASAAFVVQDSNFGIHTAIPNILGAALTFNTAGDLFVYDTQQNVAGCLYKFPGAANTAPFTTIPFSYGSGCAGGVSVGQGFAAIIATDTGRLYLSNGWEIDPNTGATIRKAFMNCGAQHGIARDPRDGALFFSNYNERKVYRVDNPDVHPETQNPCLHPPFADTGADANTGIDGLTVGPDGLVYMAGYDASTFLVYSAYSTSTPTGTKIGSTSTGRTAGAGPDGISICFGDGVSFAITADSGAQVLHRFNLTGPGGAPSYAVSTLVAGTGGYNDWTAVDPKGCIWGSTINGVAGIYRLSNADGSCMQCAAPQGPSDGCNCAEVVNVQHGATTASANTQGPCVAINFL